MSCQIILNLTQLFRKKSKMVSFTFTDESYIFKNLIVIFFVLSGGLNLKFEPYVSEVNYFISTVEK